MNKIMLINILIKAMEKYKKGELDFQSYQQIIADTNHISASNNLVSFYETKLLYFLFQNVPYYKIFLFLNQFIIHLKGISKDSQTDSMSSLLEAYTCDIIFSLDNRVNTEAIAHLYELSKIFHQHGYLDYELTMRLLKNPRIMTAELVSLDIAQNISYQQTTLDCFKEKDEDLRESISSKNYQRKNSIEKVLINTLAKTFSENELTNFIAELKRIIETYAQIDKEDANMLGDTLLSQLIGLKKSIITKKKEKETREKNNENPDQISLFTLKKQA